MKIRKSVPALALALFLPALGPAFAKTPATPQARTEPRGIDPDLLAGLAARSIGPAAMSGRVSDVAGVESDPDVLYVGAANGGVWKTENGGLTWEPLFDDQPVASIGAVAVFQPNPDLVWVGTGEANPRNSVSSGRGVYRSLDGGRTWRFLGLAETERIHRVVLHPTDPQTAWVAALGQLWEDNPERGVFKTTDGGRTWSKVLFVDERTGAADLAIDPKNPNKLFAAMWDHRRRPWTFRSGGPGSGLYVTYDGGESWRRLAEEDGLPEGDLGRIGVAVSRSNPEVVYALVEAGESALLRSDDGGRRWRTVNRETDVTNRPFYYADVRVDPARPDRVYSLTSRLRVSDDGGRSFDTLGRSRELHGDYHALWVDPNDPEHLVVGNDGGLGISRDRGESFYFPPNLPLAQYYHVRVDDELPYNVYGGLQDNGSWRGPAAVWEDGGIRNQHWIKVGGGDGFDTVPDPEDSRRGWSMAQGGALMRWDLRRNETKIVPPAEVSSDPAERLRFNWNAAIAVDPFEPGTIYYGSQYVHKSTDRGETWTTISPDLTTDRPEWQRQAESGGLTPDVTGAENFTTLVALAPSPVAPGVLWAGTDDGRLHVTRDGGGAWASVERNVPGVPANTWIPHVHPSSFAAGTAFVVFDNHRRGDWRPYVYRTDDFGASWKSLATPDLDGWALSIVQDPVDPDLLFLGTELGLWVSLDGGGRWLRWTHGTPTTSYMDLAIHPREHDLVAATHGRGVYVIDDLAPLREVTAETLAETLRLYPASPAVLHRRFQPGGAYRAGAGPFQGENEPYGVLLTYSLNAPGLPHPDEEKERERKQAERARPEPEPEEPEAAAEPETAAETLAEAAETGSEPAARPGAGDQPKVEIEIADAAGRVVRTMEGPAKLGLNRAVWDFGRDPFRRPRGERRGGGRRGAESGPTVPPGVYAVKVRFGGREATGRAEVLPDPAHANTPADWAARERAIERLGALQEATVEAQERIQAAREDLGIALGKLEAEAEEEGGDAVKAAARELRGKLNALERRLHVPPDTPGIVDESGTAQDQVMNAAWALLSSWDPPNATQTAHLDRAQGTVSAVVEEVNRLFAEEVAAFRSLLQERGIGLFPEPEAIRIGKEE
jgi:hypothetical protein